VLLFKVVVGTVVARLTQKVVLFAILCSWSVFTLSGLVVTTRVFRGSPIWNCWWYIAVALVCLIVDQNMPTGSVALLPLGPRSRTN